MDGVLIVDKPAGPTSHDVVARVRRVLGERRVGHTGTLDPAASGVLALVIGRATRLAQFLSGDGKTYEAIVRLGIRTDTCDGEGRPLGPVHAGPLPALEAIEAALDSCRGTMLQQPPSYSAKKIGGRRSYAIARAHAGDTPEALLPEPVQVTAHSIDIGGLSGDELRLRVSCSAGFYVRSLARDLGERLGVGAHLAGLRRVQVGDFSLADAVALDVLEQSPETAADRVLPMSALLPGLPAVTLTSEGVRRAAHGVSIGPAEAATGSFRDLASAVDSQLGDLHNSVVRLLDDVGHLVAVARPVGSGLLHPFVVLM